MVIVNSDNHNAVPYHYGKKGLTLHGVDDL